MLLLCLVGLFLFLLLLVCLVLGIGGRESLVGILQESGMVVESFQVQLSVEVHGTLAVDGVAQGASILHHGTSFPRIGSVVAAICTHPVEAWNLFQWNLVAHLRALAIIQRTAKVLQTRADGVFPGLIEIGIEILVDLHVGFLHFCAGSALEIEMESLEDIPTQLE